jgi:hypothetical protein
MGWECPASVDTRASALLCDAAAEGEHRHSGLAGAAGHVKLESTMIYIHVEQSLAGVRSPLDRIAVDDPHCD